jgi:hypothetical protein
MANPNLARTGHSVRSSGKSEGRSKAPKVGGVFSVGEGRGFVVQGAARSCG